MAYTIFSRTFPATHSKKGKTTFFPEKIWASFSDYPHKDLEDKYIYLNGCSENPMWDIYDEYAPKFHTFRIGHGRKVGDKFDPRIWTGKPYASPQFTFAPPLIIKKIWPFHVDECGVMSINGIYCDEETELLAATNDGLTLEDFNEWLCMPSFRSGKAIEGQILCWSDKIQYP